MPQTVVIGQVVLKSVYRFVKQEQDARVCQRAP
jgi:hypothetical protein